MWREHGAIHRGLPAGRDQNLHRLERLRRAELPEALFHLLVARKLIERLEPPGLAQRGALAFDDAERDAVDEQHQIRANVLLAALDLELARDHELVVPRVAEVEEPNRV